MDDLLVQVRSQPWFYEFPLPDGSFTTPDIPEEVAQIHTTCRDKLCSIIASEIPDASNLIALDFAPHRGYFTIELSLHFKNVIGRAYG